MSPLTEGNDKVDDIDSSTVKYVVNDEESCITAHENKIHQQTVEDENNQEIEVILSNTLFLALFILPFHQ